MKHLLSLALLAPLGLGCAARELPREGPPLVAMEEPLEWRQEPDDERARQALPLGSFTGLVVADARPSLDAMLGEPEGVLVEAVIENSPADAAGIEVGDLLLEAGAGQRQTLHWPSEWRALELASPPVCELELLVDRAGAQLLLRLSTEARVHPAERRAAERLREETRVGIVLRTATEVEARGAGLGPGAGAVVVGLTRESPWRTAGVLYQDLLCAVDGAPVSHPELVLDRIRNAEAGALLELEILRAGQRLKLRAPLSSRASELKHISVPLLLDYTSDRGRRQTSLCWGLFEYERTPVAWRVQLLWWIEFKGGDADRLELLDP